MSASALRKVSIPSSDCAGTADLGDSADCAGAGDPDDGFAPLDAFAFALRACFAGFGFSLVFFAGDFFDFFAIG
jgi:hypothetical protein